MRGVICWHPSFENNNRYFMMKKSFWTIIAITALILVSCGKGKNAPVDMEQSVVFMELSNNDTTAVYNLVNTYLDHLTNGRMDEALAMISYFENDSVKPVPEKMLKRQRTSLNALHPIRYQIEHVMFLYDTDCEVKYSGILFDKEENDPAPNKVSFIIKPVRKDGKWYLTLADSEDKITNDSGIKH